MTALLAILALGLIAWAGTTFGGRVAKSARVPIAVAVMAGLTGYLVMGTPGAAGSPVVRAEPEGFGEALEDPRGGMGDRFNEASQWLTMADGLLRNNRTQQAAGLLDRALQRYPRNIDLWVAYGNALVAHAGGVMTPASAAAFDRAADIDPTHPAPPFFAGLALAQGGDVVGARSIWQELLDRSPPNAPWRADLEGRLAQMPLPPPAPPAPPAPVTPAPAPTDAN
jgi:cytochrome c-type biogenesis protein CcmH